ncbi:MAG: hypothetical protein ACYC27_12075 [Armatimonadota bacterium]
MGDPFGYSNYLLKKQFLKLFGGSFRIYNPTGDLVLFASMKAFKLKEDIGIFSDESKTTEYARIKARSIIDFWSTYDIYDSATNQKLGGMKRKALKSMLKDEWIIMDAVDNEIGLIQEDSWLMAILRRLIGGGWVPQAFHGEIKSSPVFNFKQQFNPIIQKIELDFTPDTMNLMDRKFGIAAAILMSAIEGRQE